MCNLKAPNIQHDTGRLHRMEHQHAVLLKEMGRITQEQLQNNLDELLARANSEDIGFVILNDAGEEDTVLFPARWLEYDGITLWDPDYTKVTPEEAIHIEQAEVSGFVAEEDVDWGNLSKYTEGGQRHEPSI